MDIWEVVVGHLERAVQAGTLLAVDRHSGSRPARGAIAAEQPQPRKRNLALPNYHE